MVSIEGARVFQNNASIVWETGLKMAAIVIGLLFIFLAGIGWYTRSWTCLVLAIALLALEYMPMSRLWRKRRFRHRESATSVS